MGYGRSKIGADNRSAVNQMLVFLTHAKIKFFGRSKSALIIGSCLYGEMLLTGANLALYFFLVGMARIGMLILAARE